MKLSPSDVRMLAIFGRRISKASSLDAVVSHTFKTLRKVGAGPAIRLVYSTGAAVWREWRAESNGVKDETHRDYPKPGRSEFTVFFDSNSGQSGFISIDRGSARADAVLEVIAPQVWSALLLQSALERVHGGLISEAELIRERLRARDEERRYIACELHDDLGQLTASLKLSLKWAEDRLRGKSGLDKVARELSKVRGNVGTLHVKLRNLSHTLYPRILDTLGLAAAVKELAREARRHSSIKVTCTSRGVEHPVEKEFRIAIYRCCQEAISNALQHAKASTLDIHFQFVNEEVRIRVQDNGRGFDPRSFYDSTGRLMSSGFWTIRQRMTDLGGAFRVSTAKGKGTLVEISAPYPSEKTHASKKDKTVHRR